MQGSAGRITAARQWRQTGAAIHRSWSRESAGFLTLSQKNRIFKCQSAPCTRIFLVVGRYLKPGTSNTTMQITFRFSSSSSASGPQPRQLPQPDCSAGQPLRPVEHSRDQRPFRLVHLRSQQPVNSRPLQTEKGRAVTGPPFFCQLEARYRRKCARRLDARTKKTVVRERARCSFRLFQTDFASGWRGVQSLGGKATRQKLGLGSRNSTPT